MQPMRLAGTSKAWARRAFTTRAQTCAIIDLLRRTTNLLLEKIELGQPNRVEHLLAQRLRKNLLVVNNQETSSHSREFLPSNQVKVKVNKAYLVKQ